ncbi:hypothetical protein [Bradyrhizobium quebecense]|uniref:Uncharacterized protein n=2 Tax=Bradyrhizobium quebecense TaxID=2748629 RepID=A0A939LDQ0_9BRAD|nr:hypothetical protein [Bradyrhizobium quebecense]UGA43869.1 hypothetical protein HU230_0037465 [Bradyrhizobium quebecense]UGY06040.1 hypothetical protein J4P68_0015455 [Bradyrhizobium quebecense]
MTSKLDVAVPAEGGVSLHGWLFVPDGRGTHPAVTMAHGFGGSTSYNETHPYLAEAGQNGRQAWLAAIDKIAALNPTAVVVGQSPLDPDNSPSHIDATRQYIRDFDELNNESETARQLYDRMLALYPDRTNPGSLWASTHTAKEAEKV